MLKTKSIESTVLALFFLLLAWANLQIVLHSASEWAKNGTMAVLLFGGTLAYSVYCMLSLIGKSSVSLFHPLPFLAVMIVSMLSVFNLSGYRFTVYVGPISLPKPLTSDIIFTVAKAGGLFLGMLMGMLADGFWREIGDKRKFKEISISTAQLAKPVLVSPIVFLFIWTLLRDQPFGVVHLLVSFQNGFFWQSIFASKSGVSVRQKEP